MAKKQDTGKNKLSLSPEQEAELAAHRAPQPELPTGRTPQPTEPGVNIAVTNLTVTVGLTINTGSYENIRPEVTITAQLTSLDGVTDSVTPEQARDAAQHMLTEATTILRQRFRTVGSSGTALRELVTMDADYWSAAREAEAMAEVALPFDGEPGEEKAATKVDETSAPIFDRYPDDTSIDDEDF